MSQNQESNLFGLFWNKVTELINDSDVESRINQLQEEKAKLMKEKKISADKILQSIKNTSDFIDLQKPINKEVNEKLTSEEITRWQPIKFLFLTEENIIKILSIMVKSDQKLNKDQSKMMSPIIKKMLLDNNNVDDLISQIQKEQIMYFDNDLLKRIPIDNIKKFTLQQMNYFTEQQVTILLNRKAEELYDHIAQNIDINKIFACCVDYNLDWELIINKLPVDKFADLKKESIELLSTSLMQIILKKSYKSKIDFLPEQLSGVVSMITLILNSFDQNSIKQASEDELESLIYYIAPEEVKNIGVPVLTHLPAETIKKFKPDQIKNFNTDQIITLLKRNDCNDHILDKLTSTQIYNILNRLHEENSDTDNLVQILSNAGCIDKLTPDEIDSISSDALKIILKKSYKLEKFLQPAQLEKVDTKIYSMLYTTLENIKFNNENKSKATEDLAYLIYYLTNDQIQNMDNGILIDLPAETIKKFKPDQIKNFNTDQIITLLKRNDCSDYIINNLTAEQIYNMDFQKLLELDPDIIKKFVTKHEQKIFVSDINAYVNNLGITSVKDVDAINANFESSYAGLLIKWNNICKDTKLFIQALLNKDDFDKFILPKLTPSHLHSLPKETLVKLIDQNKISLLKQNKNISIDILKGWLEATFIIPPSKQIHGEWICNSLNLDSDDIELIYKLITQFQTIIPITGENRKVLEPYLITMHKNKVIKAIKDFNHQLSAAKTQKLNKEDHNKVGKLFHVTNLKYAGQEIAQNLSGDVIKFLNAKQIDLLIKYGVLKHFPENRINCFNEEEISKLDIESIKNLSLLCIKMRKKLNELQVSIEKDFSEDERRLYTNYTRGSINAENIDKLQQLQDSFSQQNDFNKHLKTINKFFATFISYFTQEQLKSLLKNGDGFLESEAIQKIKPEILFSNNENDRKDILHKIDVSKLNFPELAKKLNQNNFLGVDVCKKFSSEQIDQLLKSEKIKYLSPEFLIGLSDEQIGIFNTKYLTEKQILTLINENKFKHLNPEIVDNTNFKNCVSTINSPVNFSKEQQKKLIDNDIVLDSSNEALENFESDLIINKLNNQSTDKKFMRSESLINNLAKNNKINKLNTNVTQKLTVQQIKILSQCENLDLTNEQINIFIENNHIGYLGKNFVESKLTKDQIKQIKSIVPNEKYLVYKNKNLCITTDQLVSLSQNDKFCYISTEVFDSENSKFLGENWQQNLNLSHATADQINILFEDYNSQLTTDQIKQILDTQELNKIDFKIIKKIGKNVTEDQLQNLNVNNIHINTLENFFSGCQNNVSLKKDNINNFFKSIEQDNKKMEIFAGIPAFQEFYFSKKDNTKMSTLNEIILQGKKSNYANDKLFFRILQNKLSISDNQNDNSETNNLQKPIEPQVKKAYQKFINKLGNEDIKKFNLQETQQSFVNYLPLEKLINLDLSDQVLSEQIKEKLRKEKNRIDGWVNFWKHLKLDKVYLYFKQPTLEAIKQKLSENNSNEDNIPKSEITSETDSKLSKQTNIFNQITNQQNQNRGNFNNKSNETSEVK